MPYLIDGHNLIPKIPGLSLKDADDEIQLIQLLQAYQHRLRGKKLEVYFDKAAPGTSRTQRYGNIRAHFVRRGSADDAIKARLRAIGRGASTWTVVTSDREIQVAARAAHARVVSSEDFARQLLSDRGAPHPATDPGEKPHIDISPNDIEEWLRLFSHRDNEG